MYENAQYAQMYGENYAINVMINGVSSCVPLDLANTDYANIMALVDSGQLTIASANEI